MKPNTGAQVWLPAKVMDTISVELDDGVSRLIPKHWLKQASSIWKMYGNCPSCNNNDGTRCTCAGEPRDCDWQWLNLTPAEFFNYLRISAAPISEQELASGLAVAEYLGDDITLNKYKDTEPRTYAAMERLLWEGEYSDECTPDLTKAEALDRLVQEIETSYVSAHSKKSDLVTDEVKARLRAYLEDRTVFVEGYAQTNYFQLAEKSNGSYCADFSVERKDINEFLTK